MQEGISRQAARAPGGFLANPCHHTFDSLLPLGLEGLPLSAGQEFLRPMAGPLMIQAILDAAQGEWAGYFAGLIQGRRLPTGLWRLLVEIRAAGLGAKQLAGMASPRVKALAWLLGEYEARLAGLGLLDQADGLRLLGQELDQGRIPRPLAGWGGASAHGALWLRTMDLRLLRALARVMPVRVEFALVNPRSDPAGIFGLLDRTAKILESDPQERIEVTWRDEDPRRRAGLGLTRAAGRYGEVQALLGRARRWLEQGAPPQSIGLVFPDLSLYGQMAQDVAQRQALPLEPGQGTTLAQSPLFGALMALWELPRLGYEWRALARVWDSSYLRGPLWRLALGPDARPPAMAVEALLRRAGYVDAREGDVAQLLAQAAPRLGNSAENMLKLSDAINLINNNYVKYQQHNVLIDIFVDITGLTRALGLAREILGQGQDGGSDAARLAARDLRALEAVNRLLEGLSAAAAQAGAGGKYTLARALELVRSQAGAVPLSSGREPLSGMRLLSMEEAQGLQLDYLLVGGLNQGEFPCRPGGGSFLTSGERRALGRMARLPVWRTDHEEYSGQTLRLMNLVAGAQRQVMLSSSAADSSGRPLEPAAYLCQAARDLGVELDTPAGGVFGDLPGLDQAQDEETLWTGLSRELLGQGPESDPELAQSTLSGLTGQDPGRAARWQGIAQRARAEQRRYLLDFEAPSRREAASDSFSGLFESSGAKAHLLAILAAPGQRRISASWLEAYAACPAAWFWSRLIGAEPLPEPGLDLERSLEGEWVHLVLKMLFDPDEFNAWGQDGLSARLDDCLARAREELSSRGAAHQGLWQAREGVLRRALGLVAARELAGMHGMTPRLVEAELTADGEPLVMPLLAEGRGELSLRGRIDRLDAGAGAARVVDYKNGRNYNNFRAAMHQENWGRIAFQMPLYLAAGRLMQKDLGPKDQISVRLRPTALLYKPELEHKLPAGDAFLASSPEARRTARQAGKQNIFNSIEDIWNAASAGRFVPQPGKDACAYCEARLICRAREHPAAMEEV